MLGWHGEVGWVRLGSFGFIDSLVVERLIPLLGWLLRDQSFNFNCLDAGEATTWSGTQACKKAMRCCKFCFFKGWEVGKIFIFSLPVNHSCALLDCKANYLPQANRNHVIQNSRLCLRWDVARTLQMFLFIGFMSFFPGVHRGWRSLSIHLL